MAESLTPFAFNQAADVRVTRIGRRGIAVTEIDGVFHNPEDVAALGFAQAYAEDRGNLYPGVRAATPDDFSTALRGWLTPILRRAGILASDQAVNQDKSFFSVVTTASSDLLPLQRIPHFDSIDPQLLAAVIYLCDTRFSGTAFYRHRRTGFEEINAQNVSNYQLALNRDMQIHGMPDKEYTNGDSALFELIYSSELRFNSAIVYPGRVLHAARIARQFNPPESKSEWRLTLTALLSVASVDLDEPVSARWNAAARACPRRD